MKFILTRRRDQVSYRQALRRGEQPLHGDQLIGGVVFCQSAESRRAWVTRLNRRHPLRFNYFVLFKDAGCDFALQFSHAPWTSADRPYVIR